jgi:CelD/BcsL family acetyltransferase involved in cellulose biosynthesis
VPDQTYAEGHFSQTTNDGFQYKVITQFTELEHMGHEWNHILEHSAIRVPFLRYEYLSTWWQTLGGGEWAGAELFVVTAKRTDGSLVGIAPFFASLNPDGRSALMLLGSIEISDFLDVIVRPEDHTLFLEGLLDFLASYPAQTWEVIDLYNLLQDSPTLAVLEEAAPRFGFSVFRETLQPAPLLQLPADWEAYLAGLDKKQRHEIRRKVRRAESFQAPVHWYIVSDEESLDTEIEAFLGLMAQDALKQHFLTTAMRDQLRASIHAAFQAGWLQLAFLEVNGEKAAGYLNFDYDNRIWMYNSGLDYRFGELSPGWVLLAYLIQWAIDQGRAAFDFMRGDEQYKYRFGARDRIVERMMLRYSP